MVTHDAVVVGAGYAGVTAARDLSDRGCSVVLLEAQDRIGGRTFSRAFEGRAELVELGGAWFNRSLQPHMRREIQRYAIETTWDPEPRSAVFFTGGVRREGFPVPVSDLPQLEQAWFRLHEAAKRISTSRPVHDQAVGDLDVAAGDFLAPLGLGAPTRDLIYAMAGTYAGSSPEDASMLQVISQVAALGNSPYALHGSVTEKFARGTGDLISTMVTSAEIELKLSSPVLEISQDRSGVRLVTAGGDEYGAGVCVLAIPTNVVKRVRFFPEVSESKRAALADNHVSRGYKVHMVVAKAPPRPFCLGTAPGLKMIVPTCELGDGTQLLTGFGCEGPDGLDLESVDAVQQALEAYLPGAEVRATDAFDWNRSPYFDGTWRIDRPGHAHRFPAVMEQPEGRVFFAGSDLARSVWRSVWMEGALESGRDAADAAYVNLREQRSQVAPGREDRPAR